MNTNDKTSGNPRKGDPTRRPTAGAYPAARGSQPPAQPAPRTAPETGDVLARRWTARAAVLSTVAAVLPLATVEQVFALVAEYLGALRGNDPNVTADTFAAHGGALKGDPEAHALYDTALAVLLGMTAGHAHDLVENADEEGGIDAKTLDTARANLDALRADLAPTPDDASNDHKVDARRRSVIFAALATLTADERAVALPMLGAWLHAVRGHHLMVKGLPTDETRQIASDGHYAATTQLMEHTLPLGGSVVFDVLSTAWLHAPAYDADWCIAPKADTAHMASEITATLDYVDTALADLAWVTARFALGGAR